MYLKTFQPSILSIMNYRICLKDSDFCILYSFKYRMKSNFYFNNRFGVNIYFAPMFAVLLNYVRVGHVICLSIQKLENLSIISPGTSLSEGASLQEQWDLLTANLTNELTTNRHFSQLFDRLYCPITFHWSTIFNVDLIKCYKLLCILCLVTGTPNYTTANEVFIRVVQIPLPK